MNSKSLFLCFAFLVSVASSPLLAQEPFADQSPVSRLGPFPLVFEPNRGQASGDVRFLSRGNDYAVFFGSGKTVLVLPPKADAGVHAGHSQASVVTMELLRSNKEASPVGLDLLPGKSNYYIGKQSANWIAGIPQYGRVAFKSIYAGIDLVYYGLDGRLEYDFVLSPGADPRLPGFRVSGAKTIHLNGSGNLLLQVANGTIELQKPTIYQEVDGVRHTIAGNFVLHGANEVGLNVDDYDRRKPLVIDPVLSYSTLIGANNSTQVQGIAVDPTGDVYITGTTFATNYPTVAAFQSVNKGYSDVFITKLNPAGNKILYSTYLGGSAFDTGRALAVDASGSAYVTGNIGSGDFPTTPGAFMTTCASNCNEPFVTKILTDGTLGYSTFMGGSGGGASAIAVDLAGAAYITGGAGFGLPLVNAFQTTPAGGFVQKLNPQGNALEYSTYLGGGGDAAQGIAVDISGSAYVVGSTTAPNFPLKNPIQSSQVGINLPNAFITKFSPSGSSLTFSTYLGGTSPFFFSYAGDFATGVAVDPFGNVHVIGTSSSCDFPLSLDAFNADCVTQSYTQKVFVVTLNSSGSQILFSTFLQNGFSSGIAVDTAGNSYVTGTTTSNSFPVLNPIESTSQQASSTGFVTELDPSGKPLFSTYLGASSPGVPGIGSQPAGIAVDSKGGIYVAGAGQGDFPLLHPIPSQTIQNTYYTLFVAKVSPQNTPQFSLSPRVSPILALRNVSSVPLTISAITHSSNFTEGGNCGASLDPGTGCTLILEGAADKKVSGTVTITSNAYSKPQTFVISKSPTGDSVGSIITIFPTYVQFPSQLIDTTSGMQQIVIQNSGLLPAAINSILMIQPSAFTETNNCPALLNPASFCTIWVTYTAATVQDSAQLAIVTDPNQTRYTAFLSGVGSTSAIAASTPSVQFGSQYVGAVPLGRMVNFTNTTPYPASITGIVASTGFTQANTCTAILPPHGECRVSTSFSPTNNQDAPGTLTAANYGPGGPQTVNLLGTGIMPGDLTLSPASLSFSGSVGYTTGPGLVTVTNNSQKTITIQKITAIAPFLQTHTCGSSLASGATCQISVLFKPTISGPASGSLQVTFAGTGSPQTIALNGTAQTIVAFNPLSIQCGTQPVNTSAQIGVGIDNYGPKTVTLGSVTIQGSDFKIVQNSCGKTLTAYMACGLQVAFTPSAMGLRTGALSVTTSAYSQPLTAALQGTGISAGIGTLSASSVSFAAQTVGTQSQPQNVTITNTGSGDLPLSSIAASPQFFTQTNTCGSSLAAGAQCTISIRFDPSLQGMLVGSLVVQDDGVGSPHTVALDGRGK